MLAEPRGAIFGLYGIHTAMPYQIQTALLIIEHGGDPSWFIR